MREKQEEKENIPGTGRIESVSRSLVVVRAGCSVRMREVVRLGLAGRMGEIVEIRGPLVSVQALEDTTGLSAGDEAVFTGALPGVDLGPGFLGEILDGLGRPLRAPEESALREDRKWHFIPSAAAGDAVGQGDILGEIPLRARLSHRVVVPPSEYRGTIAWIAPEGDYTVKDRICRLDDGREYGLTHRRELRAPLPIKDRLPVGCLLRTGQRATDALFPVARGGSALVVGASGTGKSLLLRGIAHCCDADVVIGVLCGCRGVEAAEFAEELTEIFTERTILIVQTADMPDAARETAFCLGMTLGEYYRDMGYDAAVLVDSLSSWAEAPRVGDPASLDTRLARLWERAGRVEIPCSRPRQGSLSLICAAEDFPNPAAQAALRLSGALWKLDENLARARRFPALDCRQSRSLYENDCGDATSGTNYEPSEAQSDLKACLKQTLLRERELWDQVLRGKRGEFSEEDCWTLHYAETLRSVFLQQDAVGDFCSSVKRSDVLLRFLKTLDDRARAALAAGITCNAVAAAAPRAELLRLRELPEGSLPVRVREWLTVFETQLSSTENSTDPINPTKT